MSLIGRLRNRVRAIGARARLEREMQEEMRAHIEQATERFLARGLSPREALTAARREFGQLGVVQEDARDARGTRWLDALVGDVRFALRYFARTPMTTVTIVLTLMLGIGVTAAAFGIATGVLTRPAPGVPNDPRLVLIRGISRADGFLMGRSFSYPELMEYARLPEFESVAGLTPGWVLVERPGVTGAALAQYTTPNFFATLGMPLAAGSGFVRTGVDERGVPELTAVLSHAYAVELFGSAPSAVGQPLRVNGGVVTVVGVAPPRFISARPGNVARTLWIPVSAWPVLEKLRGDEWVDRKRRDFYAIGRLKPGVTVAATQSPARLIAAHQAAQQTLRSKTNARGLPVVDADVIRLRGNLEVRRYREADYAIAAMFGALVLLILLVCTTTVGSLLVGGAVLRRHEIGVRLAMGASRPRVVRQLLTESGLLALAGGVAGLAVYWGISRFLHNRVLDADIDPSWTTALATAVFAMATAVLCGLSPALHATRVALSGVLKDSAPGATVRTRLQRTFVVAQIALTQPLLVGLAMTLAVILRESERNATSRLADQVVEVRFDAITSASRDTTRLPAILERLSGVPGVIAVIPQTGGYRITSFEVPSGDGGKRTINIRTHAVPPGYFRAMGIPLIAGRDFEAADRGAGNPVVLGSDFASQVFGSNDPVGRRVRMPSMSKQGETTVATIVGVVPAELVGQSEAGTGYRVFEPLFARRADVLLIRTASDAAPMIPNLRTIIRSAAPLTPIRTMRTLGEVEREKNREVVQALSAAAAGGMIALLLAAVGLYAVVALAVGQRRREIGIRISVGAQPRQVVALFFRNGLKVSLLGIVIGLPLSIIALRLLSTEARLPRANTPAIAATVATAVIVVAALASWLPARRAAGVDPLVALRE